jgi:hypothetical protein
MILNLIHHHWHYALLLSGIVFFALSYANQKKIDKLFNSGRVTEIQTAERNRILCKAFGVLSVVIFLVSYIN